VLLHAHLWEVRGSKYTFGAAGQVWWYEFSQAMQCVVACCSTLQYVAVCCSVLQCAAVCCSVLQHAHLKDLREDEFTLNAVKAWWYEFPQVLQCVEVCCSMLQCVAVCCSV